MVYLHVMGDQLCPIISKSIQNCRSYGLDKFVWTHSHIHAHTHVHTPHCHCDDYVSLTTSGLDKNCKSKEGPRCIDFPFDSKWYV